MRRFGWTQGLCPGYPLPHLLVLAVLGACVHAVDPPDLPPDDSSSSSDSGGSDCETCSTTWLFGALINILGSVSINLSVNLIKRANNKRDDMVEAARKAGQGDPDINIKSLMIWRVGVTLFVIGNIMNFGSFALAAQSLLAALGCIQFVTNVIFARYINGEQATNLQLVGTAFVVCGTVLTVLFGVHTSEDYDTDDLKELYRKPVYLSYLAVQLILCAAGYFIYKKGVALAEQVVETGTAGVSRRTLAFFKAASPFAYAMYSGMIGTNSLLFSKMISCTLAQVMDANPEVLADWFPWLILICLVGTAVFWVGQQNRGIELFGILVIAPALQMVWTLSGILTGLIYFQEYDVLFHTAPDEWLGLFGPGPSKVGLTAGWCTFFFSCGIICILTGAVLLADRSKEEQEELESMKQPLIQEPEKPGLPGRVPSTARQGSTRQGSALGRLVPSEPTDMGGSFAVRAVSMLGYAAQDVIGHAREQVETNLGIGEAIRPRSTSNQRLGGSFAGQNWSLVGGVPVRLSSARSPAGAAFSARRNTSLFFSTPLHGGTADSPDFLTAHLQREVSWTPAPGQAGFYRNSRGGELEKQGAENSPDQEEAGGGREPTAAAAPAVPPVDVPVVPVGTVDTAGDSLRSPNIQEAT
eukprot:Hpha_TRINITY_DN14605_c0_g1::TRINITY_DN14605_c0_g1_i1::g.48557::m.48557